ncbi:MAG: GNAT family N-acetyltransferase [Candidatus Absconditabacterales bacterium]
MKISLPTGLTIDKKISSIEYQKMKRFMVKHDIGRYRTKQKDFYRIRDRKKIIAFGRLFEIGPNQLELGSLRVDEAYRGKKLGLFISQELMNDRKDGNDIFLTTRRQLEKYYKKIGFKIITKSIPEKLLHTEKRAIAQGIDFIIMKLCK